MSAEASSRRSHRAPKSRRSPLLRRVPVPAILGVAALVAAGIGVVHTTSDPLGDTFTAEPSSLSSGMAVPQPTYARANSPEVSRSVSRETLTKQAETQARQREAALKQLASKSEDHADELLEEQKKREERLEAEREKAAEEGAELSARATADGQWVLPVAGYTLTATFGETSQYWSTVHTGLDFAAPSGTPIVAVSSGTITSTGYDGAYGNKTVLTLDDGTEIWFCHQTSISVSSGQAVSPGDQIGTVGATGNVTGPHLHLEVRPGGGDPVDPYTALQDHGVNP
ncbi:M23 family metallopeptidase [Solicola gregarius]|uniref:M23 family metallopeptidase n=1 Tax=Solicola gregarius TaxID=2908642 RepID=A0AA46TFG3_9ACTN|nr:M23 family metallopeptidase [Solicola gregarius]UYM03889.1 M23 family metallopeptidase [Solicola gregarius]